MRVTIRFLGPIRRPPGVGLATELDVGAGATLEDALAALGYEASDRRRLKVLAAGKPVGLSERIAAGEELTIFLPLGGG
jgi:molybdopterin converting factor small subunit